MPTPSFITRLNWRLILLHFAACWCFAYAFMLFAMLHDFAFTKYILTHPKKDIFTMPGLGAARMANVVAWSSLPYPAGLLGCFMLSMLICLLKRWFWLNSFIAFLISSLLFYFNLTGWVWLKQIFLTPGELFTFPSKGYFIANASALLCLGLLCLFWPVAIRFIEGRRKLTKPGEMGDLSLDNAV